MGRAEAEDAAAAASACAVIITRTRPMIQRRIVSDDRADDVGEREAVARRLAEAEAEVPDEMAEAAEHVVDSAQAVAEEDDEPEPRAEKSR